jgi:acetylornithine/succinyldiaminopimelate/putrescine aminotransferase
MVAAELNSADLAKLVVAEMLKRHIVINCTSDTVLRLLPPFILSTRPRRHRYPRARRNLSLNITQPTPPPHPHPAKSVGGPVHV